MELLNGKAKELFNEFCAKNNYDKIYLKKDYEFTYDNELLELHRILQNALIIEWLDSVDYFIVPDIYSDGLWDYEIYNNQKSLANGVAFESRQEATTEAIKKANDIINKE
jgi:hypothetical protein